MTVLKTAARSIDFDDIERQLREVARINQDRLRGGAPRPNVEPALGDELRSVHWLATDPKTSVGENRFHVDEIEQIPDISRARRSLRKGLGRSSLVGLAFVSPIVLAAAGVSAVVMMRAGSISGDRADVAVMAHQEPARALPAMVIGDEQIRSGPESAVAPGKLDATVLAMRGPPDATAATADSKEVAAQPSAAPSLHIDEAPAAMQIPAAKVPLPVPPEVPPQSSTLGTPLRVSTISLKPEQDTPSERPTSHTSASAGSKTKIASTEARVSINAPGATGAVRAAAKKHAENPRAKSPKATSAERRQSSKPAMSILPPVSGGTTPRKEASQPQSNPVSTVANGFRKALEMAHIVGSGAELDSQ